jgi:uncharacterized membrane protein
MKNTVKIRYNHDAGESPLKWRVVINGKEHLAKQVEILVPMTTTRDFINGFEKWHVSCTPDLITWEGDNVTLSHKIKRVSHKRHLLKSISYRLYSSCITSLIASVVTGDTSLGISIGTADFLIKIFTYYVHERIWYKIPFGIEKVKRERL